MEKIIFIANVDCGDGMSGGSRIYLGLLKNWDKLLKIFFFGSAGTIKRIQDAKIRNVTFISVDDHDQASLNSIPGVFGHFSRRLVRGILAIRKRREIVGQADWVYSASDFYPDLWPAFYAKLKNRKIKWIAGYYLFAPSPFSATSPYKGRNRLRGLLYWIMQRLSYFIVKHFADFVFVTSEPDVRRFVTPKRSQDRIVVVQGGVDITESEKYLQSNDRVPVEQRKYDVCFVGRFHYQKGVVELMDIWRIVCQKKPAAKLALIGNGSLEKAIREKIKKHGLQNNVDLLGFRDGQDKFAVFKQSKIIVHPATYDSGGMAAAEGMAWGLPGVSFDLNSLKTYYPKGMVKARVNDLNDFAIRIMELLDNEDYYSRISQEAHDLIVESWAWDKRIARIANKLFT